MLDFSTLSTTTWSCHWQTLRGCYPSHI